MVTKDEIEEIQKKLQLEMEPYIKVSEEFLHFSKIYPEFKNNDLHTNLEMFLRYKKDKLLGYGNSPPPLTRGHGSAWTAQEIKTLMDMKNKGYDFPDIGKQLNRKAGACKKYYYQELRLLKKVDNVIKEEVNPKSIFEYG